MNDFIISVLKKNPHSGNKEKWRKANKQAESQKETKTQLMPKQGTDAIHNEMEGLNTRNTIKNEIDQKLKYSLNMKINRKRVRK